MPRPPSFISRLKADLDAAAAAVEALVDGSAIRSLADLKRGQVVVVCPDFGWADLDDDGIRLQVSALKVYRSWWERFSLLLRHLPEHDAREMERQNRQVLASWIERSDFCWGLTSTLGDAKRRFREELAMFLRCLDVFDIEGAVVMVPDTNALILAPDVQNYGIALGVERFEVAIPPTVLAELDKLKVHHPRDGFRDKVKGVVRRIKGWRNQGDVLEGVKVHGVTVRLIAAEPAFEHTLPHLDPQNNDDRVIASALEVQLADPGSTVILVTADINLQNKAAAAGLPFVEPPDE